MIKNYTSGKDTKTEGLKLTMDKIQKILVAHNAKSINFEYKEGKVSGLIFVLEINGTDFGFKLPSKTEKVEQIFLNEKKKRVRYSWDKENTKLSEAEVEQAQRTAWANIRDWVDAQMALIETEQVKFEEVFLPYMIDRNGKSYFEHLQEKQFLLS